MFAANLAFQQRDLALIVVKSSLKDHLLNDLNLKSHIFLFGGGSCHNDRAEKETYGHQYRAIHFGNDTRYR